MHAGGDLSKMRALGEMGEHRKVPRRPILKGKRF